MKNKESAIATAKQIFETRYKDATVAFCAGSFIRGEATESSDIDLVVLFPKLEFAWRESFVFNGWPVEAFIHDPDTLRYFFSEVDIPSGVPSLPNMVAEGIQVPVECVDGTTFKTLAKELLDKGPAPLSDDADHNIRYTITDLVDDLRNPRSKSEAIASGVRLYEVLADYYFRSLKVWSASGKSIPRRLRTVDAEMARKFENGFEALFSNGLTDDVISLAQELVAPYGGFNFDGYKRTAPKEWKKELPQAPLTDLLLEQKPLSNGMTLSIVQPSPDLAADIVAYVNQVGGESDNLTFGANQFNVSVEQEAELLRKTRESDLNLMIVGLVENRVVSVANLSRNSRDRMKHLGILGISVMKEFWGQGIARAMMDATIVWAETHGVSKIQLKVKSDNDRAIRLYEKMGFIREGFHPGEVLIDGQFHDHISMGLFIAPNFRGTE